MCLKEKISLGNNKVTLIACYYIQLNSVTIDFLTQILR